MIVAPKDVVQQWQTEARRALAAAGRSAAPDLVAPLAGCPREVGELVVHLAESLTHAAGVLAASAVNATPGAPEAFREGLAVLAREIVAEQERDRADGSADPDAMCPLPQADGTPFRCGCGEEGRAACATLAFDVGSGELPVPDVATDDGCEGGIA